MDANCASRVRPNAWIVRSRLFVTLPTRPGARWRFIRMQNRDPTDLPIFHRNEALFMRSLILIVTVALMSTIALSQTLPAPQAITDPKQISSKPNAQVEKTLSIEKLFMT